MNSLPIRFARLSLVCSALGAALLAMPRSTAAAELTAEVVDVRKIWDEGRHNAFTDLIRWKDVWWCTFREAEDHVGGDGAIRVLTSRDGVAWTSAARLTEKGIDLRDPKLTVTPDGKLMLNCGGSVYEGRTLKGRRSRVMVSTEGTTWTPPQKILKEGDWLWRITWHEGMAYGVSYRGSGPSSQPGGPEWYADLHRSKDGVTWETIRELDVTGRPNETTLRFQPNGEMIALVRREAGDRMGHIGFASPPYKEWKWKTSNHRFGGQNALRLPTGEWLVSTRDYTGIKPGVSGGARTILAEMSAEGQLRTLATFPSGGDTSYPGLVWHDGMLWMSYYSSHEGKTSIYLARVKLSKR